MSSESQSLKAALPDTTVPDPPFQRQLVAMQRADMIEHRRKWLPNLELALGVHYEEKQASSKSVGPRTTCGDLIIAKPVTRETLADFLRIPVAWDVHESCE